MTNSKGPRISRIVGFPALSGEGGQALFVAILTSTSGGLTDNTGIYFYDDIFGLLQVARAGDALLGSTITGLRSNSNNFANEDEQSGLNELGQVAYQFDLADGRERIAIWHGPGRADLDGDNEIDGADLLAVQRTDPAQFPIWESWFGAGGTFPAAPIAAACPN